MPPLRHLLCLLALPVLALSASPEQPKPEPPKLYKARPRLITRGTITYESELCRFPWYQDFIMGPVVKKLTEKQRGIHYGPASESKIKVRFTMRSDGTVKLARVNADDSTTTAALIAAVLESAPFLAWSEDMTEVLGQETAITFVAQLN